MEARQRAKLTGTNRSNDSIPCPKRGRAAPGQGGDQRAMIRGWTANRAVRTRSSTRIAHEPKRKSGSQTMHERPRNRLGWPVSDRKALPTASDHWPQATSAHLLSRPPGGHSGGPNTRSHPELGRENPQRRWYCDKRKSRSPPGTQDRRTTQPSTQCPRLPRDAVGEHSWLQYMLGTPETPPPMGRRGFCFGVGPLAWHGTWRAWNVKGAGTPASLGGGGPAAAGAPRSGCSLDAVLGLGRGDETRIFVSAW